MAKYIYYVSIWSVMGNSVTFKEQLNWYHISRLFLPFSLRRRSWYSHDGFVWWMQRANLPEHVERGKRWWTIVAFCSQEIIDVAIYRASCFYIACHRFVTINRANQPRAIFRVVYHYGLIYPHPPFPSVNFFFFSLLFIHKTVFKRKGNLLGALFCEITPFNHIVKLV